MLDSLKSVLFSAITENDGKSACPFRIAGLALSGGGIPTFLLSSVYTTYKNEAFDPIQFATSFSLMMGGLAVLAGGVALKAKTDT